MTEEQKEKLAREYADGTTPFGDHGGNNWRAAYNGYLAALNARDDEIAELKERLKFADDSIVDADKWIAKYKLDIANLEAKLDQLRNPWISVEDRLPRIGQSCFLANFDKRRCGYGKFCADDGMLTRWERTEGCSTLIYCLHEVTHWMPIPALNPAEQLISGLQEMNQQFKKGE